MNKKAIQLIEKMIEEDDYQTVSFLSLIHIYWLSSNNQARW